MRDALLDHEMGRTIGDGTSLKVDLAGTGAEESRDGSKGSRLAGAIGPDESDDGALLHAKRNPLQRGDHAIVHDQVLDFQHSDSAAMVSRFQRRLAAFVIRG